MAFTVVTLRRGDEGDCGDEGGGGGDRLYPALSEPSAALPVLLHPEDGTPTVVHAQALAVSRLLDGVSSDVVALKNVVITVLITDCRTVVACDRFEPGGGSRGFDTRVLVDGVAKAVSRARRRARVRGTTLVGHVRHRWLTLVGAVAKTGWRDCDRLRLMVTEPDDDGGAHVLLTLDFPKRTAAHALAQEIARKAAAYRLATDGDDGPSLAPADRAAFEALTQAPRLTSAEPGQFAFHTMPSSSRVGL